MANSLLKKSGWITLCVVLGGALGYGASYTQPQHWQSQAQFSAPKVAELGNYFSLFNTYQFLSGNSTEQNSQHEHAASDYAYQEFQRNLASVDNLQQFLSQQESIKILAQLSQKNLNEVVRDIISGYRFEQQRVTLTASSPEQAQQLLSDFIDFSNAKTRQTLNDDLIIKWKDLFGLIKNAAEKELGATQQNGQISQQDWKGKLALMRSVAPLDNRLNAYRIEQSPTLPASAISPIRPIWAALGSAIGLVLAIALLLIFRQNKQPASAAS